MTESIDIDLAEVTAEVIAYRDELAQYNPADIADDDGNLSGDIRLQYVDGGWSIHTGDSSYDQDHRGAWGCGSVSPSDQDNECQEISRALIEDCLDDAAEQSDDE